jgi:hypothetical protein
MDANAMEFIRLNIHSWLKFNFNSFLINFQLNFSSILVDS